MISRDGRQMDTKMARLRLEGRTVVGQDRLCPIACVDDEGYKFLTDPTSGISALRGSNSRADRFMFMERLLQTRRNSYEWDNVTALLTCTFSDWWTQEICLNVRHKPKEAEKKWIGTREVSFGSIAIPGIRTSTMKEQEGGTRI
jgi:hypothetical protein